MSHPQCTAKVAIEDGANHRIIKISQNRGEDLYHISCHPPALLVGTRFTAKWSKQTQSRRGMQGKGRQEEALGVSERVEELWYSVMAEQCSGVLWGQLEAVINAAGGKHLKQAQKSLWSWLQ